MALGYLTIPGIFSLYYFAGNSGKSWAKIFYTATSVAVECVFSWGHILLSHIQNCLSAQTTHALSNSSQCGLVKNLDITAVVMMPDVPVDDGNLNWEVNLEDGWDAITWE